MKTNRLTLAGLFASILILLTSCSDNNDTSTKIKSSGSESKKSKDKSGTGNWEGKLVAEYSGDIRYYNLHSNEDAVVLKEAGQPFVTSSGEVMTITGKFPKANYLVQLSDAGFNNNKKLLDLSEGWFGGKIYGLKQSPDGKYIAAGITSYSDYKIDEDAVVVFDMDGNIVTKFELKYQPDWTPDGRLVMCGSLMSESADGKVYTKSDPGIYISSKDLMSLTRIDPGFDDPAPVNAAVSPAGDKIAFVKNHHLWVMDLDGKNARQLTAPGGDNEESYPTWSPDGKHIACWVYKTFEKSYYTAIAIIPADTNEPIKLSNEAEVWPKDKDGFRLSGGAHQFSWVKE